MAKGFNSRGMGGMGGNMNSMLRQAQKMQQDMMKAQEELESKTYEAAAGGGVVTAVVSGKKELTQVTRPRGSGPGRCGDAPRSNCGGGQLYEPSDRRAEPAILEQKQRLVTAAADGCGGCFPILSVLPGEENWERRHAPCLTAPCAIWRMTGGST